MDFSKLNCQTAAEKGIVVEPIGPDGRKLKDVKITIAGRDSERFQNAKKAVVSDVKDNGGEITVDDITFQAHKTTALSVIEWEGIEMEGEPLECNTKNCLDLLLDPGYQWLVEQLLQAANDRSKLFLGQADS